MLPSQTLAWIKSSLSTRAEIVSIEKLPGATSSTLYRLIVEHIGLTHQYVLRLFTNREWLEHEPDLALHEANALKFISRINISTPEIIAYDEDGSKCGLPAVLMTHLPGEVVLQPPDMEDWLKKLAAPLLPLHQADPGEFPWKYYTYNNIHTLEVPGWASEPELWAEALAYLRTGPPEFEPVFIHRDYHPTNVLWQEGEISGVIDWVNACTGPAGIDLGHCRVNLVQLYGVGAADIFLAAYQELNTASTHHPYWDLLTLTDFYSDPPEMYSGWLDFGFPDIPGEVLAARLDVYLEKILESREI